MSAGSMAVGRRSFLSAITGAAVAPAVFGVAHVPAGGIVGDGVADDAPAIQAAIDVAAGRGGTVYLPAGRYRLGAAALQARSGVTLAGDGAATVLLPVGRVSAIAGTFTSAAPLTSFVCRDLAIDGSQQTGPYSSAIKGIFITHLSACGFLDLLVTGTAATGIGIDYLYDGTVVRGCRAFGCGRLNDGGQPGGAGIGIGTGARAVEAFVVEGNHCGGNARFGLFVESQTTLASTGGRVVANTCEGNRHGIGDCGMSGLVVSGNVCTANRGSGIVVNSGTLSPIVGRDGEVGGNVCTANGEFGILFDTTLAPGGSTYAFRGNRCDRNGKAGIKVVSDARRDLTGVAIVDNDIHGNGSLGVHVVTAGAWVRNVTISSNRVSANGQTNTAGLHPGDPHRRAHRALHHRRQQLLGPGPGAPPDPRHPALGGRHVRRRTRHRQPRDGQRAQRAQPRRRAPGVHGQRQHGGVTRAQSSQSADSTGFAHSWRHTMKSGSHGSRSL